MSKNNGFTKEELEEWKKYDQTFTDPMDNEVVNDFGDLEKDIAPMNEWGKYGEHELVGHGEITNPLKCGKFFGFDGCLNVDLHKGTNLQGVNYDNQVYIKKIFNSCDSPSCPVCFKRGWAVREASAIESRIVEASKKFGLAEHIIASVPFNDYSLKYQSLRVKLVRILANRGIRGGVYIFHFFRYNNREEAQRKNQPVGYYPSPHFHVIGFVDDGYAQCRNCSNVFLDYDGEVHVKITEKCLACKGFEGRTRRMYEKEGGRQGSGYIVKVRGVRKTIHGTAWYQLNHCTFVRGKKRAVVATWFGTCAKRKLKLKKGEKINRAVCPICGYDLEPVKYVGIGNPLEEFWIKEFLDDAKNWIKKPSKY